MECMYIYMCVSMCVVSNGKREVRNSANGGQREVRLWHNCASNQYS